MKKKTFHSWLALFILQKNLAGAIPVPRQTKPPQTIPYKFRFTGPPQVSEECIGNEAGEYPCSEVDLKGFIGADQMLGSTTKKLSDIWGWTDPVTGREYALVGLRDGTSIMDISVKNFPIYLGFLAAHDDKESIYRDIKTYGDYAYIVADVPDHGMQIFDLTQLRDVTTVPIIFEETDHFGIDHFGFRTQSTFEEAQNTAMTQALNTIFPKRTFSDEGYAHNIAIDEDSGYAYLVGSNNCNGGLFILDLSQPRDPSPAGCFGEFGWILDAQCVTYHGPDTRYIDSEICFISYYIGMGVIDVTDKSKPRWLSFVEDSGFNEIWQGWLTEDQSYFLVGDKRNGSRLKTEIIDVSDLEDIKVADTYSSLEKARSGNNFVKGNYLYQANYRAGLIVLDLTDIDDGDLVKVGYFDTTPNLSNAGQNGVFGVYPFFGSGAVILSSMNEGLFIVDPTDIEDTPIPAPVPSPVPAPTPASQCDGNFAGIYPCSEIDLTALVSASSMDGTITEKLSDIWGWTDPETGKEYALVGLRDGTAFVDISIQNFPIYLGFLEAYDNRNSVFRDIKTYGDYAYIVADANDHGMQIFDLTQLRDVTVAPVTFEETAHYEMSNFGSRTADRFDQSFSSFFVEAEDYDFDLPQRTFFDEGYARNIAINEDSGYAYLIGSNNCDGGLNILDLARPRAPTSVGCFGEFGWIQDAQCVTYHGPDSHYTDSEICFISYYIGMGVIDVTDKSRTRWLSFVEDSSFNNIYQGWLTEDQSYFLIGDRSNGSKLRTHIIDVSDLEDIELTHTYSSDIVARNSNIFVKGDYLYQANHRAGFSLLDLTDIDDGDLVEVGYFDTTPNQSNSGQDGVFGAYPFFESGAVILSSVDEGLVIVRPTFEFNPNPSPTRRPSSLPSLMPSMMPSMMPSISSGFLSDKECVGNNAGPFRCNDINISSLFPASSMDGTTTERLSDIWGWTDPKTGDEYALAGLRDGTAFVDVTIKNFPIYLGFLEAHDKRNSVHRDIKTYGDYAYIVADAIDHGIQIFDLSELKHVNHAPATFEETAYFEIEKETITRPNRFSNRFLRDTPKVFDNEEARIEHDSDDFGYAGNIAINEDSGYAYVIGSNRCNKGLYILDLTDPLEPVSAGCFRDWGSIEDAQCVTYHGPDNRYTNDEICFFVYDIGVGVVDMSIKSKPRWLSFVEDFNSNQIYQGWLTEDESYFLVGDRNNGSRLLTHIIDVSDLRNIQNKDVYTSTRNARPGNNFVKGHYLYQANHRAGFTVLDLTDIDDGELTEVGYFDTTPMLSNSGQDGVFGVYPFFDSGAVILSSVEEGLFVVELDFM